MKSNQEAIPLVHGDVFDSNPDARFALGVYDGADVVSDTPNRLVQAYLQLRANVYIDQIGVLEDEHRRSDGTELDEDDERSTHFVLFENMADRVAVYGCMRLIEKTRQHNARLPIENFYPESFTEPVKQGGIEVSRFIVRHEKPRERAHSKLNIIRAGLAHTILNGLGPVFATVETQFERDLRSIGIPTQKVSEPKYIEEYNTTNYGVEIDKYSLEKNIGTAAIGDLGIDKGHYGGFWGTVEADEERIA